jgi:hypothetical protein
MNCLKDETMGRLDIMMDDKLEDAFRMEVSKSMGMKKGNISLAIEEAVKSWMASKVQARKKARGGSA